MILAQEYKVDLLQLEQIFNEFYTAEYIDDGHVGFSCKHFLSDFKDTIDNFSKGQGGRMFKSLNDIMKCITYHIENRPIKNFG